MGRPSARFAAITLLAACRFTPNPAGGDADDTITDAAIPIDAPDGPPGATCYGSLETICFVGPPTTPSLTLSSGIVTNTDGRCDASVIDACALIARTITVTGSVPITGTRPLILLATESLTVADQGTLDASSSDLIVGAGASSGNCAPPTAPGDGNGVLGGSGTSGGGGAGGTFGAQGSPGGQGSTMATAIAGGTAPVTITINTLRGGCPGGTGGKGGTALGGSGGASGGALYLIAGAPGAQITLVIEGKIYASGAKALGGSDHSTAGGGGGSGGMIALEATTIQIGGSAIIAANGGGGAGGGGGVNGGANGANGTTASFTVQANGGAGSDAQAGDGGKGSTVGHLRGDTGTDGAFGGGGGGGGAVGIVWTKGSLANTARFSPLPTQQ